MDHYIWINNTRYYYYDTYPTWNQALKQAQYKKKRNRCKYYIITAETQGILDIIAEKKYRLYLNKSFKLW